MVSKGRGNGCPVPRETNATPSDLDLKRWFHTIGIGSPRVAIPKDHRWVATDLAPVLRPSNPPRPLKAVVANRELEKLHYQSIALSDPCIAMEVGDGQRARRLDLPIDVMRTRR